MDIRLDDNHDIAFNGKDFKLTGTVAESLAQRLKIKLLTFYGEWFLDSTEGIDYYGSIYGKNRSKQAIDTLFMTKILEEDDVTSIASFESEIDKVTREYNLSFNVLTTDTSETVPVGIIVEI